MKKETRKMTFYIVMIIVFGLLIYWVVQKGNTLYAAGEFVLSGSNAHIHPDGFQLFTALTTEHIQSTVGILLLQLIIILATCRIVGMLFKKIGQPMVIGEIVAGILLGPSVFGYFFPQASAVLFPESSLIYLKILSQFGLILFMYIIGMELDLSIVRKRFQDTVLISHASTIVPFFLGIWMALYVYEKYTYEETQFLTFAFFIGISLSITAFPVLARIIQERGMTRTHLGTISLASAANGDITAWCMLAAVIAYAQAGTMNSAIYNVLFALMYIGVMIFMVRPVLRVIGDLHHNREVVSKPLIALMFFILLLSSYITEILGLHALFGAFVAGMVMPENFKFRKLLNEKLEDVSLSLFLPLFFVYTGLQTKIGLIQGTEMWVICGMFILVAVVGKFGGTLIAARFSNESWKNSLYMGALMNTRGLIQLVVLSIGLEMHILTPVVFVMMVIMTLVTTFMTMPLISFINVCFRTSERIKFIRAEKLKTDSFKVLLSFGRASSGQVLLDLAHQLFSKGDKKLDITALHLTVGSDVNPVNTKDFEKVSFAPILYEADKLNLSIKTRYDVCSNATQHICSIVNDERYDFLLVGSGVSMSKLETDVHAVHTWKRLESIFFGKLKPPAIFSPSALLHDKTKDFIEHSHCSVGIFINRQFIRANNILAVFNAESDLHLLIYIRWLQRTTHGFVQLMDRVSPTSDDSRTVAYILTDYVQKSKETAIPFEKDLTDDIVRNTDLILVTYHTWQIISEECKEILKDMPSTLIIHHNELSMKSN